MSSRYSYVLIAAAYLTAAVLILSLALKDNSVVFYGG